MSTENAHAKVDSPINNDRVAVTWRYINNEKKLITLPKAGTPKSDDPACDENCAHQQPPAKETAPAKPFAKQKYPHDAGKERLAS